MEGTDDQAAQIAACVYGSRCAVGGSGTLPGFIDGLFSMRLSARQRAMEVSSVHSPGFRWKGPPPVMSVMGSKVPDGLNSRVVPRVSPTASPRRQPR